MDTLSDILTVLKPESCGTGGFAVTGELSVQWPEHQGIKCYALVSGECWLCVEGVAEPVALAAGDCFLLPRGRPFRLTTDLGRRPMDFREFLATRSAEKVQEGESERYLVGGHFVLKGPCADMLLQSLPPIVHLRKESDKSAMRWSLERMRQELREPQPGGALIVQQMAYTMLVQALRLHLADGARDGGGWMAALADKQLSMALRGMHEDPRHPWTLKMLAERTGMSRTIFAQRFKETVGTTPMEYLTRWRMLLAGQRLLATADGVGEIAQSLGYESESAFSKAFRRVMGSSPRQYRRGDEA